MGVGDDRDAYMQGYRDGAANARAEEARLAKEREKKEKPPTANSRPGLVTSVIPQPKPSG